MNDFSKNRKNILSKLTNKKPSYESKINTRRLLYCISLAILCFPDFLFAGPGFQNDSLFWEISGDTSIGQRSEPNGGRGSSGFQRGFSGSFVDEIEQNNKVFYYPGKKSREEAFLIYNAYFISRDPAVTATPGYGGRIEYGLTNWLGFGAGAGGSIYRAHGYSSLSYENLLFTGWYLSQQSDLNLNDFSESINWLYLTRKENIPIFAPRWVELETALHFFRNSSWDPYLRVFAGGSGDRAYGGSFPTYGAGIGIRYFPLDSLYAHVTLVSRSFDVPTRKPNTFLLKAPPSGHMVDQRFEAGFGFRTGSFLPLHFGGLTKDEAARMRRMIYALKRIGGIELSTRDNELVVILLGQGFFPSGSDRIYPAGRTTIVSVSRVLKNAKGFDIEIEGHTDSDPVMEGDRFSSNDDLSEARAEMVMDLMIKNGVSESQLDSSGYGEDRPRVPNTSAANKQLNRRIEILVDVDLSDHPDLLNLIRN